MTFDCPACGHHLRSEREIVGKRVSCTHCGETFVVSPESDELIESQLADADAHNPFGQALFGVWTQMKTMEWSFPFLHNLVSMVILLFVIGILVILYPTIGLSIHLAGIFRILMSENIAQMRRKPTVEKIGHAVSIGVFLVFFCVFGIVALPFYLLGLYVGALVDGKQ